MAQFDVHRNPGRQQQQIPYVVVVQSSRYDRSARRAVVPLSRLGGAPRHEALDLSPVFTIAGEEVALDPLQIQTVPLDRLGPAVASLADDASSDRIIKAIDLMITRAYG